MAQPETNPKEMVVYELPNKKCKITIITMLSRLGETMHEQNQNLNKQKENIFKLKIGGQRV